MSKEFAVGRGGEIEQEFLGQAEHGHRGGIRNEGLTVAECRFFRKRTTFRDSGRDIQISLRAAH